MNNEEIEKNENAKQEENDVLELEAAKKARRDALVALAKSKSLEIAGGVATTLAVSLIAGFLKKNIEAKLYAPKVPQTPVIIDQNPTDQPM